MWLTSCSRRCVWPLPTLFSIQSGAAAVGWLVGRGDGESVHAACAQQRPRTHPHRGGVFAWWSRGRGWFVVGRQLDGLETRRSVYVIAATNRPDIIDRAMLRPGKYVGRAAVLAEHNGDKKPLWCWWCWLCWCWCWCWWALTELDSVPAVCGRLPPGCVVRARGPLDAWFASRKLDEAAFLGCAWTCVLDMRRRGRCAHRKSRPYPQVAWTKSCMCHCRARYVDCAGRLVCNK